MTVVERHDGHEPDWRVDPNRLVESVGVTLCVHVTCVEPGCGIEARKFVPPNPPVDPRDPVTWRKWRKGGSELTQAVTGV